jgi:hypothetical protein
MRIKQKLSSVVKHVKSHPALYGYIAGAVVAGVSMEIILSKSFDKELKKYITGDHMLNLETALEAIKNGRLAGLYFPLDNETLLLHIAPENFQP